MTDTRFVARLDEAQLMLRLREATQRGRTALVELLILIGEVDARRSYRPEGYSCMYHFCREALHMGDGEAFRRIRVAKVARRHPAVLAMLESGHLHLTAVVLLSRHLRRSNAQELLEAARHKTKSEIQQMLAERFPQPDVPQFVRTIHHVLHEPTAQDPEAATTSGFELTTGMTVPPESGLPLTPETFHDEGMTVATPEPSSRSNTMAPRSPGRFAVQAMLDAAAHEDLVALQALLSHAVPAHDLGAVLGRALAVAREVLEKQRHAQPERSTRSARAHQAEPGYIPAHVRRQVWARDGQRCTFVGRHGHRCNETHLLELDHITPVARGGTSRADNLRVRCRAHNQYEAEQAYGVAFMQAKRARSAIATAT